MHQEPQLQVDGWLAILYEDLRHRAAVYLQRPWPVTSIRPTELVHEAYLRIVRGNPEAVNDQGHLFALASVAMRQILVEEARARRTIRRGGGWKRLNLEDVDSLAGSAPVDVLDVDAVLTRLEAMDPRAARIVEMKVFGGFTDVEIGQALDISDRWVRDQWSHARAWLKSQLSHAES